MAFFCLLFMLAALPTSSSRWAPIPIASSAPADSTVADRLIENVPTSHQVIVSQNISRGDFITVAAAVAFATQFAELDDSRFIVWVRAGVYHENVVVNATRKNLVLIGDGINRTTITSDHNVDDGSTTVTSATFGVNGDGFIAIAISFVNSAGPQKHQAVALRSNSNYTVFHQCSFEGYQDTLFVQAGYQFFHDCEIYGTVDFIFGNAAALFQASRIYVRQPLPGQPNAIIAQGRESPNEETGIVIHLCSILAAPGLSNSTNTYLGRPWKHYARTIIMQSNLDSLINPDGWLEWNPGQKDREPYYGEYANYGDGSDTSHRVTWEARSRMNISEALAFTAKNFIHADTWLPNTFVPYTSGLIP